MKFIRVFLGLLVLFITVPLSIYQSWLLYKHVHATDVMWLLFWINWPIVAVANIIETITQKIADKE